MRILSFIFILLAANLANADTLDARAIMEKVDAQQRQVAHQTLTLSRLSSCAFARSESGIVCTEEPRVKVLESYSIQEGPALKDSKSIAIVLEPANERGIGMLTYSYDDTAKDTESWLYLSALGKVKRLASGSGEDQEPVSFFGSEFTTEDMENGKTDEYDYRILQSGPYAGSKVWVIEAVPRPVRVPKTRYSKLLLWIDQDRFVPLKMQGYDRRGELWKRMSFAQIEQHNGLWLARQATLFNLEKQRLSTMHTDKITQGVPADSEFLTQRPLVDFAYRERVLQGLRAHFE
ncbi:MAG: outer membrane lipoprotein-sorting protein [Oleiphilaceae bacterium]|nr:outer membrane lipoprotein-sorting protein [Oleiphilaceae bacterium]